MSPYVEQVAALLTALFDTERCLNDRSMTLRQFTTDALAPRVDAALMRAYWQGWDDGITERGKIQPSGAAGRGVLAALGELRGAHTGEPAQ